MVCFTERRPRSSVWLDTYRTTIRTQTPHYPPRSFPSSPSRAAQRRPSAPACRQTDFSQRRGRTLCFDSHEPMPISGMRDQSAHGDELSGGRDVGARLRRAVQARVAGRSSGAPGHEGAGSCWYGRRHLRAPTAVLERHGPIRSRGSARRAPRARRLAIAAAWHGAGSAPLLRAASAARFVKPGPCHRLFATRLLPKARDRRFLPASLQTTTTTYHLTTSGNRL